MPVPKPGRRSRVDLNKLNPFDPADMRVIDAEWRRRRAAKHKRQREVKGWVRVFAVIVTYCALAWLVITLVYLLAILMLALFA
jgi:hypothetical protein